MLQKAVYATIWFSVTRAPAKSSLASASTVPASGGVVAIVGVSSTSKSRPHCAVTCAVSTYRRVAAFA